MKKTMQQVTHKQIWDAIDRIADSRGMTASALARRAGLDPTAFNPSKRTGPNGRARWLSMETISKVLDVVGMDLREFAEFVHGDGQMPKVTGKKPSEEMEAESGTDGSAFRM